MPPALDTLMLVFSSDGELPVSVPERGLFLGAVAHPALRDWPSVTGWQPDKALADAWERAGFIRIDDLGDERWPVVLVLPGKSREETLAWFTLARDHVASGGTIVVAMPNTAGARRFEKLLAQATGDVVSLQKHKCRAFRATNNGGFNESVFDEWRVGMAPQAIPETSMVAQAGTFSANRIDPGSIFLADHLPRTLHGSVADLGAGWGYLSDAVLKLCPKIESLDLFEVDARAVACARANLGGHDRSVTYHWHDVTTGLPTSYDAIVMNPPFHTGQATNIDLGRRFMQVAMESLNRDGELFLVANRQLPYESVLESSGLEWRIAAEDKTYKLLFAKQH